MELNEIAALLQGSNRIVITSHLNPDGDNLGAVLSLKQALVALGKQVQVVLEDAVPKTFRFLPGSNEITKPQDHKWEPNLFVVLDSSDFERVGKVSEIKNGAPIVNIDHHVSNVGFGDYQYVDAKAAATCEIIFELIQLLGVTIDADMALNLYAGIATDCGFFRYSSTTPKTHRIAAQLLQTGFDPSVVSDAVETRSRKGIQLLQNVLSTLEFFCEGRVACLTMGATQTSGNDMTEENTEGFVNFARYVEGIEVACLLRETDSGTKISLRSRRYVDVSETALVFGGGGHKRASGYSSKLSIEEAKQQLVAALEVQLDVQR